ncbi:hypothetical protein JW899_02515 [Candidatus Uhrbacteria bacterium]|nr:hypothetical protein [Candidatus Uhrbacteria bacterium]
MIKPEIASRVIGLTGNNGERVVLVDSETGRAVVVMDLDTYEGMVSAGNATGSGGAVPEPISGAARRESSETVLPEPKKEGAAAKKPVTSASEAPAKEPVPKSPYPPVPEKKDPLAAPAFADLTQSELLDKINRDIASWKNAQEDRKREGELAAVAKEASGAERPGDVLEDEERFYLEPVE